MDDETASKIATELREIASDLESATADDRLAALDDEYLRFTTDYADNDIVFDIVGEFEKGGATVLFDSDGDVWIDTDGARCIGSSQITNVAEIATAISDA